MDSSKAASSSSSSSSLSASSSTSTVLNQGKNTKDFSEDDKKFMTEAFVEARKAHESGEVPVGCVIVSDNEII